MGEFELIGRIAGRAADSDRFEIGIGDDAAVISARGRIVTSVDTAVAGVHFGADRPPAEVARKAVASAVSDIAAMGLGSESTEILVALGAPPETESAYLEGLGDGVVEAASEFGVQLAGGDVVSSPVVFLSVTVIAHVDESTPIVGRAGAMPGDLVAMTGAVGGAAAGLALEQGLEVPGLSPLSAGLLVGCQLRPDPELVAAPILAAAGSTSMIDVSDGLSADLGHIASGSGVVLRIESAAVPLAAGVPEVATAAGRDPVEFALSGGEDYVLALTIPQESFESADAALVDAAGFGLAAIGRVEESDGEGRAVFLREDGTELPNPGGHDHFGGSASDSR